MFNPHDLSKMFCLNQEMYDSYLLPVQYKCEV